MKQPVSAEHGALLAVAEQPDPRRDGFACHFCDEWVDPGWR